VAALQKQERAGSEVCTGYFRRIFGCELGYFSGVSRIVVHPSTQIEDTREDPTMNTQPIEATNGSLDGEGAADHDHPFKFGRKPRVAAPYPFSTRQYARLLVLRGRVQGDEFGTDDLRAK